MWFTEDMELTTPISYQSIYNRYDLDKFYLTYFYPLLVCFNYATDIKKCLCIGLGGGHIPLFLQKKYPNLQIDVVEIDYTYNMAGQTNIKTLEIKTEYGTLNIPGDKMERVEVFTAADGQTSFKLMASKHISSNTAGGWLNTGVMVKKGQKFSITANGQVVLASLSGAKYTADGKTAGTTTTGSTYDYGEEEGGGSTYPSYGNVVYKIGEQGPMLKAGAKFSGESAETGILYLSIYEVVYNAQNGGSYLVKVEAK